MPIKKDLARLRRDLAKLTGRTSRFGEGQPVKKKEGLLKRARKHLTVSNARKATLAAAMALVAYRNKDAIKAGINRTTGGIYNGVKGITSPSQKSINNINQANAYQRAEHDWLMNNPGKKSGDYATYIARSQPGLTKEQLKEKFDIWNWIKVDGAMYLIIDYAISKLPNNSSFTVKDVKDKKLHFSLPYNDARIITPTNIEKTAAEQLYKKNIEEVFKNKWISVGGLPYFVKGVSIAYPPQPSTFTVKDGSTGKDIVFGLSYNDPSIKYLNQEEIKVAKQQLEKESKENIPIGGRPVEGFSFDFGKRRRNRKSLFGRDAIKDAKNRFLKIVRYNGSEYLVLDAQPGEFSTKFKLKKENGTYLNVDIPNDSIIDQLRVVDLSREEKSPYMDNTWDNNYLFQ